MRKSFNEKLNDSKDMPKIEVLETPEAIARYGGSRMLLAPPIEYDTEMRLVEKGKLTTSDRIRGTLAKRHGADFTCPLTAGIFINIAANASEERAGIDPTPYWRTLKRGGEINEKFPGYPEKQKNLLEKEGHKIVTRGKRIFVENYEEKLM